MSCHGDQGAQAEQLRDGGDVLLKLAVARHERRDGADALVDLSGIRR
jgi:hypothetical protein